MLSFVHELLTTDCLHCICQSYCEAALTVCCRDILLLEVGFLSILIAPVTWFPVSRERWFRQHDNITLWLVKWLLFRLMFSSAVVKLQSGCPTWWGLTGTLAFHVMLDQFVQWTENI